MSLCSRTLFLEFITILTLISFLASESSTIIVLAAVCTEYAHFSSLSVAAPTPNFEQ
ncbi:hypothetical protein BDV36DRAFT_268506 [Aspergillus pseudocaelatus]|uniref:Uncharacterized protein n=1 Tax=Aspergillus pseudocaelatus TaxID=1825620 RepID=A0ABQ6W8F9_9EURO|nr:hypothetical protein BDV36DRAFT_268506 [Aspergillus pseudocaelatus]